MCYWYIILNIIVTVSDRKNRNRTQNRKCFGVRFWFPVVKPKIFSVRFWFLVSNPKIFRLSVLKTDFFWRSVFKTEETDKTKKNSKDPKDTACMENRNLFVEIFHIFFLIVYFTEIEKKSQLSISFNHSHVRSANRDWPSLML